MTSAYQECLNSSFIKGIPFKTSTMRFTLFFLLLLLINMPVGAQSVNLPKKSPLAHTGLTIGYTNIGVNYSAPSVLGRDIWGELVPYDEAWRAGANATTTVSFSTNVKVAGQDLEAGEYALLIIPRKDSAWSVIFNSDLSLRGTRNYDEDKDVLRVEIRPKFARTKHQEILTYEIVRQNIENGFIRLSWEKLRLYLPIKLETMDKAVNEIQKALKEATEDEEWSIYLQAADFLYWSGAYGPAQSYAQQSLDRKPSANGYWLLARIKAEYRAYPAAINAVDEALRIKDETFESRYGKTARKLRKEWQDASGQ